MRLPISSVVLLLLACSGTSLNVGRDEGGPSDGAGTGAQTSTGAVSYGGASNGGSFTGGSSTGGSSTGGSGITSCNDEFPFLGIWDGNVLDYAFEPVENVRLELLQAGAGGISGTITFGEGEPLEPATDPNAAYPPGASYSVAGQPSAITYWPGHPYPITQGAACDATFRFGINTWEIWDSWCRLQEPVYQEEFGWVCTLKGAGPLSDEGCHITASDGRSASYTGAKCALCKLCVCEESGCYVPQLPSLSHELVLDERDGSEVLSGPDPVDRQRLIRLERAE